VDTEEYVRMMLKEHLLTKDYPQLSYHKAKIRMDTVKNNLKQLIR